MIRVPINRTPTHPSEMLLEEFLVPMGITKRDLANAIHVPYQRINELITDGGVYLRAVPYAWRNFLGTHQISG
jgi:hypothetical protein